MQVSEISELPSPASRVTLRAAQPPDAEQCGKVAYEAHQAVSAAHNFSAEVPSVDLAIGMMTGKLKDPHARGLVAERAGQVIGSVFLTGFPPTPIAAIGPLTVLPSEQGKVGRQLMEAALEQGRELGFESIRLVQSPFHLRSLALYVKLGFEVREPLLFVQGSPPDVPIGERRVRLAEATDIEVCNRLCLDVHGLQREAQLRPAVDQHLATVVERDQRIVGYAAGLGFLGHAVAETTDDLKALISQAPKIMGPGFFVPTRNGELLRWLLAYGFRGLWPATLMSMGTYQDPAGAFLPAISF
ncbi:MAG TPA: GNAT family N-acetyltransferase [Chloroflexota bacterium]|jgi:predicted N-acetyltransferase YhbS|nr:GNAT family N-acetyltransferase [Chloroflexota bacterium]